MDDGKIFIGNDVMMGPNVSLLCTNHPLIAQERARMRYPDGHVSMSEFAGEIHIEDDVWLAANVVVIDGVTIGRGAVIGAGSVVTRDIPAGWLAAGVPPGLSGKLAAGTPRWTCWSPERDKGKRKQG